MFRLTRQMPYRVAIGHLITGRRFDAARAYELGLINEVVPAVDLDASVTSWVEDILSCSPLSVHAIKEAAASSATMSFADAFTAGYVWEERRMHSADAIEGPLAFTQRRDPVWRGR